MKRKVNQNIAQIIAEGVWVDAEVQDVKETHKGCVIYAQSSPIGDAGYTHMFQSDPIPKNQFPDYIGNGSIVKVCVWDERNYIMDYDGDISKGYC